MAAAAHALSGEICEQCGGPGDPVRLAGTPTRTTRCGHCCGTADEGPAATDPRASYRSYSVVEDVLTDEDLTALMEAREHDGWPAELAGGVYGMPYWLIRDTGWNGLIRAAFTLLLPLQCDGQAQPLRLAAVRVNGHRRPRADLQSEHVPSGAACCEPAPLTVQGAPLQTAAGRSSGRVPELEPGRDTSCGSPSTARSV